MPRRKGVRLFARSSNKTWLVLDQIREDGRIIHTNFREFPDDDGVRAYRVCIGKEK